jgi:hypothetical protein
MGKRLGIGLCLFQGCYFLATGLWPLVSIKTFQMVTGPKTDNLPTGNEADHWLVNTVAVLVISIGVTLLFAGFRRRVPPEVVVLAIVSSAGLIAIDTIYVWRGVLRPIYLTDAVLETLLIVFWLTYIFHASSETAELR